MNTRRRPARLGRQIALFAAGNALLLVLGLSLLFGVSERRRVRLDDATRDFVEEARIAERINQSLLEQLIAVTAATGGEDTDRVRRVFVSAGDVVNQQTRRYLQRDLSPAERLEVERLREEHQRLEVAAAHAFALAGASGSEVVAARQGVFDAAVGLREALEGFLALREQALQNLAEQQRALLAALRFGAIGLTLALVAGTLLFARFLRRRLTVPLHDLEEAATRVGAGEAGARVEPRHDDELGHLAASFNTMAASVAEARRVLEQRNTELGETLRRLRDAQADLVQTEKLGALGRMIAGLAHELNNPLASVLGHSELLAARLDDGDVPGERELRDAFVGPVVKDAGRARDLVRSLLQFSRRSTPELEVVPLAEALEVALGLRRFAFEHAGLRLDVDVPDVLVLAERQRLQQIFLNLANNALEAMADDEPRSGRGLTVRARIEHASVVVTFEDDGPGVARPDRVFDPFYTTKDVGEGTGLGLTLVHGFLSEFGGDIRVENRPEGGARFTLWLPLAAAQSRPTDGGAAGHAEPPAGTTTAETRAQSTERVPATERARPAERPSASGDGPGVAPDEATGPCILVVEDEAPLRRLQEQILKRMGARVHLAVSGNEAKRLLAELDVDLVVSDVKMPDGNGIELYDWIRRERPDLGERVLLVTGNLGDPAVIDIAEAQPHRVVAKPFSREEYLARVRQVLEEG